MQITLVDDRRISLVRLRQSLTYYGMLAGVPHRRENDRIVAEILERAQTECIAGGKPCLIAPVATPLPCPPPAPERLQRLGLTAEGFAAQWAARHHETLPAVACVGHFDSGELKRPGSEPYSSLTIVWFQDRFALPVDSDVLAQIERLDWDALARDWIW